MRGKRNQEKKPRERKEELRKMGDARWKRLDRRILGGKGRPRPRGKRRRKRERERKKDV